MRRFAAAEVAADGLRVMTSRSGSISGFLFFDDLNGPTLNERLHIYSRTFLMILSFKSNLENPGVTLNQDASLSHTCYFMNKVVFEC